MIKKTSDILFNFLIHLRNVNKLSILVSYFSLHFIWLHFPTNHQSFVVKIPFCFYIPELNETIHIIFRYVKELLSTQKKNLYTIILLHKNV